MCAAYYQNFADHRINNLVYRDTGMYECGERDRLQAAFLTGLRSSHRYPLCPAPIIASLSDKNDSVTLYTARFDALAEKLLAMGFRQLRLPTPFGPSSGGMLSGCSHS